MKVIMLCVISLMSVIGCSSDSSASHAQASIPDTDSVFVAVEGDGAIAAIDGRSGALHRSVPIMQRMGTMQMPSNVHNVQADSKGHRIWATVMTAGDHQAGSGHVMSDELVALNATTLQIEERIKLGGHVHAAHVVIAEDTAYVTATETDTILVVDLPGARIRSTIRLPYGAGPHGARVTRDGKTLVVAAMGNATMLVVDTTSENVETYELRGMPIQVALLPNDTRAYATIYTTRQVACLDLATRELKYFDMPPDSAGPVQLYPTPDGAALWVADQGMLLDRPAGQQLVKLDANTGAVLQTVQVGAGPHGVIVDPQGVRVWVTTVVQGYAQMVDTDRGSVVATTQV